MAEASGVHEVPKTKSNGGISRRGFLGLMAAALGGGALVLTGANEIIDKFDGFEERLARFSLAADVKEGKFALEQKLRLDSLDGLRGEIAKGVERLRGVSESQVFIAYGDQETRVRVGTDSEVFQPASTIKVPICYEAWRMGQRDGREYLTSEHAENILGKSWTFRDLVLGMPIAEGRGEDQLEEVTRDLLIQAEIPPKNALGDLPLRVGIDDYFTYLIAMDMPEVMRNAMLLDEEKDSVHNYGVTSIVQQNLKGKSPAYFKIGLTENYGSNSYFLQIGNNLKVLGYAQGNDISDVHEQMLQVAAYSANFAFNVGV